MLFMLFAIVNVNPLVSSQFFVLASEPRYQAPSLLKSPIDVTARQGLDLSIVMECFPNRR